MFFQIIDGKWSEWKAEGVSFMIGYKLTNSSPSLRLLSETVFSHYYDIILDTA
jgi:hypothetical protein